jgi:hypothetical protein
MVLERIQRLLQAVIFAIERTNSIAIHPTEGIDQCDAIATRYFGYFMLGIGVVGRVVKVLFSLIL